MTEALSSELNPYEPPRLTDEEPVCVFRRNPGAKELHVQLVHKGWMRRMVRFYGEYEGLVDWNAAGPFESVSIDARVVVSKLNLGSQVVLPRFEFPVDVGYPATMSVEIGLKYLFFVGAFRILLDGRTLYAEGGWSDAVEKAKPR